VRPRPGLGEAYRLPRLAWLIAILSMLLILTAVTDWDNIRFRACERFTGYSPGIARGSLPSDRPAVTKMRGGCSSAYREFGAVH
jgi:hypothetical protein